MMNDNKTYEERRAEVAARHAAYDALPDEAKKLLQGMHLRLVGTGRNADYAELKRLVLELWGPK
jgi:hypothetical protein